LPQVFRGYAQVLASAGATQRDDRRVLAQKQRIPQVIAATRICQALHEAQRIAVGDSSHLDYMNRFT
jgi:hypothetical protein